MGWEDEAWRSAAQEYGARRAEKWGKWWRFSVFLSFLVIVALVLLTYLAARGTWG